MTDERAASDEAIDRAARIIARALADAEIIIATDRERRQQQGPQMLDTLERFSVLLGKLVEHTEHLADRMTELTEAVAALADARAPAAPVPAPAPTPQLPEMERAFAPGGEGIDVTIESVPGFQGLMELQRALVRLPEVQSAAVRKYQDDEAAIQLVLAQPMTASALAAGITGSTGHPVIVDEALPGQLRLRLRFLDAER
ncbi:MAG: hypothetical protein KGK07_11935 [Chloroflexota bacterium]|nr:hypothetical protein [Chloroflexota bacterium]